MNGPYMKLRVDVSHILFFTGRAFFLGALSCGIHHSQTRGTFFSTAAFPRLCIPLQLCATLERNHFHTRANDGPHVPFFEWVWGEGEASA